METFARSPFSSTRDRVAKVISVEMHSKYKKNVSAPQDYSKPVLNPGGGGGFSHTLPIRVCAAQRGRDFEAPDLERGIHFRGVF